MTDESTDPLQQIQGVMQDMDPDSLCTGVIVLGEWISADGRAAVSVMNTPMTPWHLAGIMEHARRLSEIPMVSNEPCGECEACEEAMDALGELDDEDLP